MVTGSGRGINREQGGLKLIYVNVDTGNGQAHLEVNGTLDVIIADVCTVLREVCKDGKLDPEFVIDVLKDTFLDGMAKAKAQEDGEPEQEEPDEEQIESLIKKLKLINKILGVEDNEVTEDGIKDERSKEALPGTNRRYRRVRPH